MNNLRNFVDTMLIMIAADDGTLPKLCRESFAKKQCFAKVPLTEAANCIALDEEEKQTLLAGKTVDRSKQPSKSYNWHIGTVSPSG